jgi:hypothetical protein
MKTKITLVAIALAVAPLLSQAATFEDTAKKTFSYSSPFDVTLSYSWVDLVWKQEKQEDSRQKPNLVDGVLSYSLDGALPVSIDSSGPSGSGKLTFANLSKGKHKLELFGFWNLPNDKHLDIVTDANVSLGRPVFTAAVPEPETYAMMMAGLGMMGFMVRRRKSSQS